MPRWVDGGISGSEGLFDDLGIDIGAELHRLVVVGLVGLLSTLGLDVLLDGVDLRLVRDEALL